MAAVEIHRHLLTHTAVVETHLDQTNQELLVLTNQGLREVTNLHQLRHSQGQKSLVAAAALYQLDQEAVRHLPQALISLLRCPAVTASATLLQLTNAHQVHLDPKDHREKLLQMVSQVKMAKTVKMPNLLHHLQLHRLVVYSARLVTLVHLAMLATQVHKV
jgi:hypothetical protein